MCCSLQSQWCQGDRGLLGCFNTSWKIVVSSTFPSDLPKNSTHLSTLKVQLSMKLTCPCNLSKNMTQKNPHHNFLSLKSSHSPTVFFTQMRTVTTLKKAIFIFPLEVQREPRLLIAPFPGAIWNKTQHPSVLPLKHQHDPSIHIQSITTRPCEATRKKCCLLAKQTPDSLCTG